MILPPHTNPYTSCKKTTLASTRLGDLGGVTPNPLLQLLKTNSAVFAWAGNNCRSGQWFIHSHMWVAPPARLLCLARGRTRMRGPVDIRVEGKTGPGEAHPDPPTAFCQGLQRFTIPSHVRCSRHPPPLSPRPRNVCPAVGTNDASQDSQVSPQPTQPGHRLLFGNHLKADL